MDKKSPSSPLKMLSRFDSGIIRWILKKNKDRVANACYSIGTLDFAEKGYQANPALTPALTPFLDLVYIKV